MDLGFSDLFEQLQSNLSSGTSPRKISAPNILDNDGYEQRRKKLKQALSSLCLPEEEASLSDESIDSFVKFFTILYSEESGFSHRYSDVTRIIYEQLGSQDDLDRQLPAEALILSNRVEMLRNRVVSDGCNDYVRERMDKLVDHIDLEQTRIQYMTDQNARIVKAADDAKLATEKASEAADKATEAGTVASEATENVAKVAKKAEEASLKASSAAEQADDATRKVKEADDGFHTMVDDTKRDYVTILGIFAAVVIAFTAGMSFSSSVLQSMADVSIYRLTFMALVIGFFLFNLVSILLVFLLKVSRLTESELLPRVVIGVDAVFVVLIVVDVLARFIHLLS